MEEEIHALNQHVEKLPTMEEGDTHAESACGETAVYGT